METRDLDTSLPLIVIVGPTASGKTSLAITLALKYDGEIICADSRTVYKNMNVGTAKPTSAEQASVPHWGLDLIDPGDRFTVADFKRYAEQKIDEVRERRHVPFLVGGTGLYIDAVLFNYQFGNDADQSLRDRLNQLSLDELHKYCISNNIMLPENKLNKRYVIRVIEQKSISLNSRSMPRTDFIIVGIATDKDILRTRIAQRSEQLFDNDVVEEAILLGEKYGWDNEAMTGNIYPLIRQYVAGEQTLDEVKQKNRTLDWRLAKRQMTWFKRHKSIEWKNLTEAEHYLSDILASLKKS